MGRNQEVWGGICKYGAESGSKELIVKAYSSNWKYGTEYGSMDLNIRA